MCYGMVCYVVYVCLYETCSTPGRGHLRMCYGTVLAYPPNSAGAAGAHLRKRHTSSGACSPLNWVFVSQTAGLGVRLFGDRRPCMDACMHICMYACVRMCACTYALMYVCVRPCVLACARLTCTCDDNVMIARSFNSCRWYPAPDYHSNLRSRHFSGLRRACGRLRSLPWRP